MLHSFAISYSVAQFQSRTIFVFSVFFLQSDFLSKKEVYFPAVPRVQLLSLSHILRGTRILMCPPSKFQQGKIVKIHVAIELWNRNAPNDLTFDLILIHIIDC